MDQDNQSQSQAPEDNPNGAAEASTTTPAKALTTAAPATDSTPGQPPAPARPRRPQRSARVEGSVDISEPKAEPKAEPEAEPKAEPTAVSNQEESTTDGSAASRPKTSGPEAIKNFGDRTGPSVKARPKGPGHHPVRAASVPHPAASRPVPPHLNPHAQRALSVAGTADTQAQTVEDFRQVSSSVCVALVSACLHRLPHSQTAKKKTSLSTHSLYLYSPRCCAAE